MSDKFSSEYPGKIQHDGNDLNEDITLTEQNTAIVEAQKNEITLTPKMEMMPLEEMGDLMQKLDVFIKNELIEGKDYGHIPGTGKGKKPLWQPGMQKLNTLFGHYPSPIIETEELDHHIKWEYEDKSGKTKTTIGFFYYRVRCDLKNRRGEIVTSYHGSCSSREKGRETNPSNSILKMAEKRAQMSATVNVTFCSERFSVDIDGYDKTEYGGSDAPDGTITFGKHKGKNVKDVDDGWLSYCAEKFDAGPQKDMILAEIAKRNKEEGPIVGKTYAGGNTGISTALRAGAPEPTQEDNTITTIVQLEATILDGGFHPNEKIQELRKTAGGSDSLETMSPAGQRNYLKALVKLKGE